MCTTATYYSFLVYVSFAFRLLGPRGSARNVELGSRHSRSRLVLLTGLPLGHHIGDSSRLRTSPGLPAACGAQSYRSSGEPPKTS
jgi:hypothetical protein